jgi:hypothetical protein
MYSMNFDITIGKYRLAALEKVAIKCSVENLADTADITLPGTLFNRALKVEQKIAEGDAVRIRLGYDRILRDEFSGYVSEIATDNDSVRIHCEDELYKFRKDLKDRVLKSVTVKTLLTSVAEEVGKYEVACDYDFTYDNFTIHAATGYDVLRKVQSETKANIYLRGKTLHVHPQYAQIGEKVIYDFAVNIEKSDLKYRDASKRKFLADGRRQVYTQIAGCFGSEIARTTGRRRAEGAGLYRLRGLVHRMARTLCRADMAGRDPRHGVRIQERKLLRVGCRNDFLRQRCEPGRHHRKTHRKQWITPRR